MYSPTKSNNMALQNRVRNITFGGGCSNNTEIQAEIKNDKVQMKIKTNTLMNQLEDFQD